MKDTFLIAMKAKDGAFCLFVESLTEGDEKKFLKHTTMRTRAKTYSFTDALDAVELLKEYKITAKILPMEE